MSSAKTFKNCCMNPTSSAASWVSFCRQRVSSSDLSKDTITNTDVRYTLRKACPDRLLYPEHMSQIRPAVRILGRICLTVLPADRLYGWFSQYAGQGARSSYTPFSCKKPSRDEQPGPPFVLAVGLINSLLSSDACRLIGWMLTIG